MEWFQLMAIYSSVLLLVFIVNLFLRRIFKIEREKSGFFSSAHVNGIHKKVDITIRVFSLFTYVIITHAIFSEGYSPNLFLMGMALLTITENSVQAFFEWKDSPNPKQAILTVNEMFILVTALTIAIEIDLFGYFLP